MIRQKSYTIIWDRIALDHFRAFVIYNYRITYQVKEAAKEICILRIRYTSREPLEY
jgi:hypothetical protein